MDIDSSKVEASLQHSWLPPGSQQSRPEKSQAGIASEARPARPEIPEPQAGNDQSKNSAPPADLNQEASNMLELLSRQSMSGTPLSFSSKAARAVMNQF
jgi:hypothetical protein